MRNFRSGRCKVNDCGRRPDGSDDAFCPPHLEELNAAPPGQPPQWYAQGVTRRVAKMPGHSLIPTSHAGKKRQRLRETEQSDPESGPTTEGSEGESSAGSCSDASGREDAGSDDEAPPGQPYGVPAVEPVQQFKILNYAEELYGSPTPDRRQASAASMLDPPSQSIP